MDYNIKSALDFVLKSEGGYANVAGDPGGPTNHGVTQREYNAYLLENHRAIISVRSIGNSDVTDIYKHKYWDTVQGDKLPAGLDYAVFDFAVNSGPHQAIVTLQKVLNTLGKETLAVDGILGNVTMQAIRNVDTEALIRAYVNARLNFDKGLGALWSRFGLGWTHRLFGQPGDPGVLTNALSLLSRLPPVTANDVAVTITPSKPKGRSIMDFASIETKVVAFIEALVAFITNLVAKIGPILGVVTTVLAQLAPIASAA